MPRFVLTGSRAKRERESIWIILAIQRNGSRRCVSTEIHFEPNERKSTWPFIPGLLPIHAGCKLNFVTTCNLVIRDFGYLRFPRLKYDDAICGYPPLWILNTILCGAKKQLDSERSRVFFLLFCELCGKRKGIKADCPSLWSSICLNY